MPKEFLPGGKLIAYPQFESHDSFGRVRGSQPFNLFSTQFNYGLQPLLFEQLNVDGNIIHIPSSSAVRLSNGGIASGNSAIFQSKHYFRYLPGLSHQIIWTCVLGAKKNNVQKIIGYFDSEDGLAFIQDDSGIGVLRRTSTSGTPVNHIVLQSEWNLDKLDGSDKNNPSGIKLDLAKDNIFIIDFQWLGAGRIRYGFDFGGHITYVHQIQFANTQDVPFMRTANLPFRVEIMNTGTADSETTIDFTCLAINSEGGSEPIGLLGSTSNANATLGVAPLRPITSANSPLPLLSIRPRTTFKSLINRGQVRPMSFEIASKDAPIYYSIVLNGALVGSSFSNVNTNESIVQVDKSATSISGGVVVESGYLGGGVSAQEMNTKSLNLEKIILSNNINGNSTDTLSIVIGLANNINSDCGGAFTWKELF